MHAIAGQVVQDVVTGEVVSAVSGLTNHGEEACSRVGSSGIIQKSLGADLLRCSGERYPASFFRAVRFGDRFGWSRQLAVLLRLVMSLPHSVLLGGVVRLITVAIVSFVMCGMVSEAAAEDDPDYLIRWWGIDHGLPENSATAMVQTPDGYLWFGTFNGLVRFDGIRFEVVDLSRLVERHLTGIVNLHLDGLGWLWVSTLGGLVVRNPSGWRSIGEEDGWLGDFVRTFAERDNGELLFSKFDGNIIEYADERFTLLEALPGSDRSNAFVHAGGDGSWWAVSGNLVAKWDGVSWVEAAVLPSTWPAIAATARDGRMWVLSGDVLLKYVDGVETERRTLPEIMYGLWSLYEDSAGNVWICTFDRGLCRVDPSGGVRWWREPDELASDGVRFVFEDQERNLWVGTSGGGLARFMPRRFRTYGLESGLTMRVVSSVWPDPRGGMLVGTYGKGLLRFHEGKFTPVSTPGFASLQSVMVDRAGRKWIGSFGDGLLLREPSGERRIESDQSGGDNIIALFEDSRGRVWISGGDAVSVYVGGRFHVFSNAGATPLAGVCGFAQDSGGAIWATNRAGVFRLDGDHFVQILDREGGSIDDVICLKAGIDQTMWMGLRSGGLLRWGPGGRLDLVGARAAFPAGSVNGIVEDDQGVWWIASNRGVLRVRRDDLEAVADGRESRVAVQSLGVEDGLASIECSGGRQPVCVKDSDGRIWFATLKGVAVIDPSGFRLNTVPPPVLIEEVSYMTRAGGARYGTVLADDEDAFIRLFPPFDGVVRLPAGSRRIEVRYTGLSFVSPEKVRFETMLEPVDIGWVSASAARAAVFHDLSPGTYRFRVRSANNDGFWNADGAVLTFVVEPYMWQMWWFRGVSAIALVSGIAGGVWWLAHFKNRQRLRAEELFRQVFESAPNALIMTDADGVIGLVNGQTEKEFGYGREELIGKPVEMLIPERFRASHPSLRRGYVQAPAPRLMGGGRELFGVRRDGAEIPLEIGLSPIHSSSGLLVLVSITNISERLTSQLEIAQKRNELAHLSRVTMLGELSGSLAHELNQPLTAILSNAQAAQQFMAAGNVNLDDVREILADIVEQDKRAGEIIYRLRGMLRKEQSQRQPMNICEAVDDVLRLLHSDLINRRVDVRTELLDIPLMVSGDRVQIQQVLVNLFLNACDAMTETPEGERWLVVQIARVDGKARVSVSDSGHGFAPGESERVFEPFYSTKNTGMGLGLVVCRSIIDAHGGTIEAVSRPRGAAFVILLPLLDEAEQA